MVRWETRGEEMVQVHYDEDVANHIGPEPCSGIREGADRVGQPLSHENGLVLSADAVTLAKGNMPACANANVQADRRGLRTRHIHIRPLFGNRDILPNH